MNPKENYGFGMMKVSQCRLIHYNTCTTLGMWWWESLCMCRERGYMELSILSAQICCETHTALKTINLLIKKMLKPQS